MTISEHKNTELKSREDRSKLSRRQFLTSAAVAPLSYGVITSAAAVASTRPVSAQANSAPVALITGASSGFGNLTAKTLARNGFHVIASMRDIAGANVEAAAALRSFANTGSMKIDVVEIDIDSDESVTSGVAAALSVGRRIDVLFNNAGISIPGPIELSMEAARRSFETNVFGQLRMLRAVAPIMRENRNGLIIQMSSGLGRFVIPTSGIYCATKFAQEAMFESAAYELHPFGVEVAIIQPSDYATDIKANSRRYFQETLDSLDNEDRARETAYAEHIEISWRDLEDTASPPAQEVADVVLELATTAPGERPLRQVSMPPEIAAGVNDLNMNLEGVQSDILNGTGLGHWLTLAR